MASTAAAASSFAGAGVAPLRRSSSSSSSSRAQRRGVKGVIVRAQAVSEPQAAEPKKVKKRVSGEVAGDQVLEDELAEGVTMVRCVCRERLKFEVEYGMKRGTTNNSYLIAGATATALLDLPDKSFAESFAKSQAPNKIDFIVLGHLSPKRLDTLAAVLAARPPGSPAVEVCCSNPAAQAIYAALKPGTPASSEALTAAWKVDGKLKARLRTIKSGDVLDLGGGRVLSFTAAPTPRWPDSVVTHDSASGLLFTSKLFSAHVATPPDAPTDASLGWNTYGDDWQFFFDCMLAPMARPATAALARLEPYIGVAQDPDAAPVVKSVAPKLTRFLKRLEASAGNGIMELPLGVTATAIAPLHGPVIESAKNELVREYRDWLSAQVKRADESAIAVIYASAYGNTSAMAQAIARGITKAGVAVEMLNCELSTAEEVEALIKKTDGLCLGSPTLGGHMPTPISAALGVIVKEASRDRPAGVFGSFGWSGEAVDLMESRLKDGGFKFAFSPIRCKFTPTAETLQVCEESGTDLAQAVKKLRKRQVVEQQKSLGLGMQGDDAAAAVGRIVGSLCCVTAKSGEAQSAMLASWVSQASFNPPALTVAVAKERAVESFLLKGAMFNLNVLQAGNEKDVMKQLLKPFKPGENRFGDMEVQISENNGCAIVTQALSYVECEVTSRMECGDHWVVLATVRDGKLLQEEGVTAIHHRKTGTNY